jgi:hypothetical protein
MVAGCVGVSIDGIKYPDVTLRRVNCACKLIKRIICVVYPRQPCLFSIIILSTSQHQVKMKKLPTEVWTMIANHAKRTQPPPRVKANWNDNFNQQDLTSLLRVDKVRSSC